MSTSIVTLKRKETHARDIIQKFSVYDAYAPAGTIQRGTSSTSRKVVFRTFRPAENLRIERKRGEFVSEGKYICGRSKIC